MLRNMASLYIKDGNQLLMLYRIGSEVIEPSWCGIGGHFENSELNDPKKCVLRELYEETGIKEKHIGNLQLRYITLRLKNNEIRQNYYFFADIQNRNIQLSECDEGILEWINFDDVIKKEMPFSAKYCLRHYFRFGKNNAKQYAGIATEAGLDFVELSEF